VRMKSGSRTRHYQHWFTWCEWER